MGLLEETNTGADFKRYSSAHHLHLQLHRVIVRPVKDGDFIDRHTFTEQFKYSLGYKIGLLNDVSERYENRSYARLSHGPEILLILSVIIFYTHVRKMQDLRRAAVVCLKLENLAVRDTFQET